MMMIEVTAEGLVTLLIWWAAISGLAAVWVLGRMFWPLLDDFNDDPPDAAERVFTGIGAVVVIVGWIVGATLLVRWVWHL